MTRSADWLEDLYRYDGHAFPGTPNEDRSSPAAPRARFAVGAGEVTDLEAAPVRDSTGDPESGSGPDPEPPREKPRATRMTAGGGRLPPPGHVIDLDAWTEQRAVEHDAQGEDHRPAAPAVTEPELSDATDETTNEDEEETPPVPQAIREDVIRVTERVVEHVTHVTEHIRDRLSGWPGTMRTWARWTLYNGAAALGPHLLLSQSGYPGWSAARWVHDLLRRSAQPPMHPSAPLIFGAVAWLAVWLMVDRPLRHLPEPARFVRRLLLAAVAAGTLAATWTVIVHYLTGVPL